MTDHRLTRDQLKLFGEVTELYEVTTFIGYRNHKSITVRILDLGPECDNPLIRFMCEAVQEDGKEARGNNAQTVDEAISGVHWKDLD